RRLVRVVQCEIDRCAIGDDLANANLRGFGVKGLPCAKRRNCDLHAFGGDATHAMRENTEKASPNGQLFNCDEWRGPIGPVNENDSIQCAPGIWKISGVKGSDAHAAVSGVLQILYHR